MAERKQKYALIEKPPHCYPAKQNQTGFPTACHREERSDAAISWYPPRITDIVPGDCRVGLRPPRNDSRRLEPVLLYKCALQRSPKPSRRDISEKAQKRPLLAERPGSMSKRECHCEEGVARRGNPYSKMFPFLSQYVQNRKVLRNGLPRGFAPRNDSSLEKRCVMIT